MLNNIIYKYIKQGEKIPQPKSDIPKEMLGKKCNLYEGEDYFSRSIPSQVTNEELFIFEEKTGVRFPDSYRTFLKFRHFLNLFVQDCNFPAHLPETWQKTLISTIFEGYPREKIFDIGRIPFADWEDWGILCFDTTVTVDNFDYPIVLWDHERPDRFEFKFKNFASLWAELDT